MSFSSESIEAKLCAYIEGDLDAEGRAEIERHLAGNPQHKKLIEELIQTRELIRTLPRVSAPPEVREQLTNQMERSLLLGADQGTPSPDHMRLRRFPQFAAAAAVLVLTLGLGAVVWFVLLPTFRRPMVTIAPTPQATQNKTEAAPEETEAPAVAGKGGGEEETTRTTDVIASKMSPGGRERREAVHGKGDGGFAMKGDASTLSDTNSGSAQAVAFDPSIVDARLTSNGYAISTPASPNGAPVYVVVSSTDPSAASAEVQQFLSANKIQWEPVPAEKNPNNGISLGAPSATANPTSTDNATGSNGNSQAVGVGNNNNSSATSSGQAEAQQPAAPADHPSQVAQSGTTANWAMNNEAMARSQQAAPAVSISSVYVARRMTKDQAAQLQASLAQPRAGQQCTVFQRPTELRMELTRPGAQAVTPASLSPANASAAINAAPTTRPDDPVLAKQAPAPAPDRLPSPTTNPSDASAEHAMTPVPATAPSANEAMGGSGGAGGAATQPTADVQSMPAPEIQRAIGQQTIGQLPAAAPATQPAPAEAVDVVIVVQNQTTPANAPVHENSAGVEPNARAAPPNAAPPAAPAPATQPTPEQIQQMGP